MRSNLKIKKTIKIVYTSTSREKTWKQLAEQIWKLKMKMKGKSMRLKRLSDNINLNMKNIRKASKNTQKYS